MSFLFGGARVSNTNSVRDYQRKVAGNARGMEREVSRLDHREALLQRELGKCAKDGKMDTATAKAKEIVRLRAHRERLRTVGTQMTGLAQQLQSVQTTGKVQEMISDTVGMLHTLNGRMDAGGVARMLSEFERQNVQMQAKQELMHDALDSGFEAVLSDFAEKNPLFPDVAPKQQTQQNGRAATGRIGGQPAQSGVMRFDAQGNQI